LRYVIFLILIVIDAFAATDTVNLSRVYDAGSHDTSIWYLGQIFGSVFDEGRLVDDTIITNSIKIFNAGLIAFIGGSVATTIGVSTINTAREGVFMGRMLPTAWYPLRVVVGTSFLAPTINGYSGLQVLILWLAMQGANLANNIWEYTTDFVKQNGGTFSTDIRLAEDTETSQLSEKNYKIALNLGLDIMQAQSCTAYNKVQFYNTAKTIGVSADKLGSEPGFIWVAKDGINKSYQAVLPENQGSTSSYIACGKFLLPDKKPAECFLGDEARCEAEYIKYNDSMRLNFDIFYSNLQNNTQELITQCTTRENCVLSQLSFSSMLCTVDNCPGLNGLESAARIFAISSQESLERYLRNVGQIKNKQPEIDFGAGGWISAGNFYDELSILKSSESDISLDIEKINLSQTNERPPRKILSDDFNTYLYLKEYFNAQINLNNQAISKKIDEMALSDFRVQQKTDKLTNQLDDSLSKVKQKMYVSLVNIMPKYCASNSNNELSLCSTKSVTQDNTILSLLTSSNTNDFNRGVELYNEKNQDLIATNQTLSKSSFWCAHPVVNVFSFGAACDDGTMFSSFSWIWGGGPNVFEEVLGQNVQVYIYNIGKAWLDMFADDTKFPNLNVIYDISQFGRQLVQHNFNFLTSTVNTIYAIQYNADMFYLTQSITMQFAQMGLNAAAEYAVDIGSFFINILGPTPVVGPFFIVVGLASAAVGGILIAGAVGAYSYAKAKLPFDQALFNWRSKFYIPVVTAVTVPLITLGMMLWLFLPMLPFLVYLFTVIGWFISIIEAVVAAPLIAAGITNPQGHEFLGKSEQSLMLMISVVIRPALILISFMFSIILTYVAIKLTTNIMMTVMAEIMSRLDSGYLGGYFGVLFLSYMFVYTMFQVINYTFSIVYEVPAKVMRWIGTPKEDTVGSAIAAIKGEVNQMFGKFGESGKKLQGSAQNAAQ
jgi:conjugal transfer/type IV secretion protein DotA/TraY